MKPSGDHELAHLHPSKISKQMCSKVLLLEFSINQQVDGSFAFCLSCNLVLNADNNWEGCIGVIWNLFMT